MRRHTNAHVGIPWHVNFPKISVVIPPGPGQYAPCTRPQEAADSRIRRQIFFRRKNTDNRILE